MLPAGRHPDDDTLERYSMGHLGGTELEWLEEHLLFCELCRRRLQGIEIFLRAMREATAELFEPVTYLHQTEAGPVYLQISREGDSFHARLWGAEVEAERSFAAPRQALHYLERVFAELFPGHRCSAFCGR